MDIMLFNEMLAIDSTSGREREFAAFLAERMAGAARRVQTFEVDTMSADCPQGCAVPVNLLVTWGEPKIYFCTHLDTVPPYIAPQEADSGAVMTGRGTCDAKGQIFAMYEACQILESRGLP